MLLLSTVLHDAYTPTNASNNIVPTLHRARRAFRAHKQSNALYMGELIWSDSTTIIHFEKERLSRQTIIIQRELGPKIYISSSISLPNMPNRFVVAAAAVVRGALGLAASLT